VILEIILRGRAKSTKCLNWLRFPSRLDSARSSGFQLLRAHLERRQAACCDWLAQPSSLIEGCSTGWSAIGLQGLAAFARKPRIDRRRKRNLSAASATWFIRIRLGISMAELISLTQ
jgi:hypothetical protein